MAVLGAQLVITLVVISVIQKLGSHYSLGRWLLCSTGLIRYLYPTNNELRQLANIPNNKSKNKSQRNGRKPENLFRIPLNLDVQLETAKVSRLDVMHLHYYPEYQWLVDFSFYAFVVYLLTEVYQSWFSLDSEINLSMLWCTLVIIFAFKLLLLLTVQYFKGEESMGERSTCIVMGFAYLVISMIVLIIDENTLETGLEKAYFSFNKSAAAFLETQGLNSSGPASKIVLKFFIALWSGILGAIVTFPGLRIARMHWDLLRYYKENKVLQVFWNLNFSLPFLLIILWIRPLARDYLMIRILPETTQPQEVDEILNTVRIVSIIFTMVLKIVLTPWYLQAYLDMAYNRTVEQKKEAGRTTNVEFQKKIGSVFYYLCVVAIQYIAPALICLSFTLMYKTLGEYNWSGLSHNITNAPECLANEKLYNPVDPLVEQESVKKSAAEFHVMLESLKSVFTAEVFRGLFGFSTWWCCFVYFATTSLGLIYHSYFTNV